MWNHRRSGGVKQARSSTVTTGRIEQSDAELVDRARAGDAGGFVALVRRYQTAAVRLAAVICGSPDDAADITQEALLKAHRSLPTLSDPALVGPWLLRIVANEAKNHLRGRYRRRIREDRFNSWVVAPAADPEDSALAADDVRGLTAALGRISMRDRQVIACRYFAGLSEAETAITLDVAHGTVKSRTARALERLRAELGEER
jgi:RNA polymerase sigma-70 factor (ECF subfamily)